MNAGTLEIQMLANLARLQQDMGKANSMVSNTVRQINSALSSIGVGLTFAGITSLINSSINALDHIHDLSLTTNLAAEDLAGLSLVAKQSGTDIDGLAKAVDFLAKSMGKAPEDFKKLGINSKDPLENLKLMSDLFNQLGDDQQRAATFSKAFGKQWETIAPVLALGSAEIQKGIDQGKELSGVTKENADRADEFKDELDALGLSFSGIITNSVGPLLPMLIDMAKYTEDAGNKAKGAASGFSVMETVLQTIAVLGANVSFVFKAIGENIYGNVAALSALAHGDLKGAQMIVKTIRADIANSRKELDAFEQRILNPKSGGGGGVGAPPNRTPNAAAAARAAEFLGTGKEAAAAAKKLADAARKDQLDAFLDEEQRNKKAIEARIKFNEDVRKAQEEQIDIQHKATLEEAADAAKAFDDKVAMDEQLRIENEDLNAALIVNDKKRAAAQLELEHQRKLERINMLVGEADEIESLRAQEDANYKLRTQEMVQTGKDGFDELKRAVEGFGNKAADAFIDFAFKGKASFTDMVNSILEDLARLALKRGILDPLFESADGGGLMDFFGSIFGGGSGEIVDSYASGTNYVPRDMLANIHKGEKIIPAGQNDSGSTGGITVNVSVDATGSAVQSDSAKGNELGKLIAAAVKNQLITEMRPRGLLNPA